MPVHADAGADGVERLQGLSEKRGIGPLLILDLFSSSGLVPVASPRFHKIGKMESAAEPAHPGILTGGSGTLLWPTSRKAFPKQFAALPGEKSLYEESVTRFSRPAYAAPPILKGVDHLLMVMKQANKTAVMDALVAVEPVARELVPALLAVALMLDDTPDVPSLVAHSDHVMADRADRDLRDHARPGRDRLRHIERDSPWGMCPSPRGPARSLTLRQRGPY